MKTSKNSYRGIQLVKVEKTNLVVFNSCLEKQDMIEKNKFNNDLYAEIGNNSARVFLYIAIDTESGCALNEDAVNYYEVKHLIDMYL